MKDLSLLSARCRGVMILMTLMAVTPTVSAAPTATQLAGNTLNQYPFFEYVKAFNVNATVEVAIDPTRFPAISGQTCDVYVVAAKGTNQWIADTSLTDVTPGGSQAFTFNGSNIQGNTLQVAGANQLNANAGLGLGVGHDVVLDCNQDGQLNTGDYIDGLHNEAGLYMVHDTTAAGPLAVTELIYNLNSTVAASFNVPGNKLGQNLYYPSNVASMGQLPLIIISRGNGHNFQWYDHIGNHLASYGYVVMSHDNDTEPGVLNASITTLGHTDAFIDQVNAGAIASGALIGHLNTDKITWIGHSRGAEGVAIAYDRLFDLSYSTTHYNIDDIKLISSMLPTDFQGTLIANPHDANYHLWTAAGDSDVSGSAGCVQCQTFHLHDRATGHRQSTVVQGTGHGWFHDNDTTAGAAFTGPCPLGTNNDLTHLIQLGHFLPLVKRYIDDNIPSIDFLTRQYESFRPIGVPTNNACIVVTHEYRDGSATGNFMIDDYQTQTATGTSSSGGTVSFDVQNVTEGLLDDNNSNFTWSSADPFNGATQGRSTDTSRGVVFDWTNQNRFYEWQIIAGRRDFTDNPHDFTDSQYLSFRAAQGTQHPNTLASLDDLTFTVTLRDGSATSSSIHIGAFGGGVEQPYQRSGGWHNEMETTRIRITDFLHNGSGLDLTDVVAIRFDVGPAWGSSQGRMVVDDLMITNDRAVYDGSDNGDPHIRTVNGVNYDFHGMGEFVVLQKGNDTVIQARQKPVTTAGPINNAHTGLASCVSLNSAVAAQVGDQRISYQPSLDGSADPDGMQLRLNGRLLNLQDQVVDLGGGGSLSQGPTGQGITVQFPDGTTLVATPHWWSSHSQWYLNLGVFNTPAYQGIMGFIPAGDWLPALPDGQSMGPKPASVNQRFEDLNKTFANAWRVTDQSSLFDYAPGQSTATFTNHLWPPQDPPCDLPSDPPVVPIDWSVAMNLCERIQNEADRLNCANDVAMTGERGFARAYWVTQQIEQGMTRVVLSSGQTEVKPGAPLQLSAAVTVVAQKQRKVPQGHVQFRVNGKKLGRPIPLDEHGEVNWRSQAWDDGKYVFTAQYLPADELWLKSQSAPLKVLVSRKH
jgi:hypothetical protein